MLLVELVCTYMIVVLVVVLLVLNCLVAVVRCTRWREIFILGSILLSSCRIFGFRILCCKNFEKVLPVTLLTTRYTVSGKFPS